MICQLCPSTVHHLCFSKLLLKPTYLISWWCDILLSTKGKSNAAINSWSCWTTSTSWFATATPCNPKSSVWLKSTSDFVWSSYCSNKFPICIWKDSQTRFPPPPKKKIFSNPKKHQSNAAINNLVLKFVTQGTHSVSTCSKVVFTAQPKPWRSDNLSTCVPQKVEPGTAVTQSCCRFWR